MRTEILPVLVVALWAGTTPVSSFEQSSPSVDSLVAPTVSFATNLMKEITTQTPGKNIIMSPLSVSTALAMVFQGAKENSYTQLQNVLKIDALKARKGYQSLLINYRNRRSKVTIKLSNSVFVNQNFDLVPEFQYNMGDNFLAFVDKVDFSKPVVAAKRINNWVSNATNGLIEEIINPSAITGRSEVVLANAVYFKGQWSYPFIKAETVKAPFYKDDEHSPVEVDMMKLSQDLRAGSERKNLKAKWAELPYEHYDYALIVVLPDDNVDALIQRMGPENLKYLATTTSSREVKLKMPKFRLESELSLVPILQSMGVQDIFSQNSNLEGLSLTKRPVLVSDIRHKAIIDVNEDGTEASAATGIFVNTLSLPPDYEDLEIILNRPFLAILLDKHTKLPVFMAKVQDPTTT